MARVTNATGKTATDTKIVATSALTAPSFKETGIYPITVTITYPEGCGSSYICDYKKDDGTIVTVTDSTEEVPFYYHGNIVASVSDGTNTISNTYTVTIKLRAIDLTYDNSKTGLDCEDAQCAIDAIDEMIDKE